MRLAFLGLEFLMSLHHDEYLENRGAEGGVSVVSPYERIYMGQHTALKTELMEER